MKICFVTNNISYVGGQQKILTIVANGLSKAGIDVSILFTSPKKIVQNPVYKLDENINIFWSSKTSREKSKYIKSKIFIRFYQKVYQFKNISKSTSIIFSKKEIQNLEEFLNKKNFDVVIGLTPHTASIIALANIRSKKIGWMHSTYDRYFESKDAAYNLGSIYNYTLSRLDAIIVLTDSAKERYSGEIETTIKRIYNPLTISTKVKAELSSNNILFVGRLYDQTKGLRKLIDIVKLLVTKRNDFKLTIVGDGPDRDNLSKAIIDNDLTNQILLAGSTDNVGEYYKKSSILVVPSLEEGFGLVVTEAMGYGIPVISFSTEGPREIIQDGIDGFLIENYNIIEFVEKLNLLLENEERRKTMGLNASKKAQQFQLDNILSEWMDFLEDVIE